MPLLLWCTFVQGLCPAKPLCQLRQKQIAKEAQVGGVHTGADVQPQTLLEVAMRLAWPGEGLICTHRHEACFVGIVKFPNVASPDETSHCLLLSASAPSSRFGNAPAPVSSSEKHQE